MSLNTGFITKLIMVIVLLVVAFQLLADTAEDVGNAADNITAQSETYPLTSFFKRKGVILLALMAGVAITLIVSVLPKGGK